MASAASEISGHAIEVIGNPFEFLISGAVTGLTQFKEDFNRLAGQAPRLAALLGCG